MYFQYFQIMKIMNILQLLLTLVMKPFPHRSSGTRPGGRAHRVPLCIYQFCLLFSVFSLVAIRWVFSVFPLVYICSVFFEFEHIGHIESTEGFNFVHEYYTVSMLCIFSIFNLKILNILNILDTPTLKSHLPICSVFHYVPILKIWKIFQVFDILLTSVLHPPCFFSNKTCICFLKWQFCNFQTRV